MRFKKIVAALKRAPFINKVTLNDLFHLPSRKALLKQPVYEHFGNSVTEEDSTMACTFLPIKCKVKLLVCVSTVM
jgi:hypothetical protein